jgi:hypothetical protein
MSEEHPTMREDEEVELLSRVDLFDSLSEEEIRVLVFHSRKFGVASDPPRSAPGTRERRGGTASGWKCPDQVAFVAPSCSKGLRLVTALLPEKSPIGAGQSRTSHARLSRKSALGIVPEFDHVLNRPNPGDCTSVCPVCRWTGFVPKPMMEDSNHGQAPRRG